jgi:hypothetical protein
MAPPLGYEELSVAGRRTSRLAVREGSLLYVRTYDHDPSRKLTTA